MYLVELQPGVWKAATRGDPGRTLLMGNAQKYDTESDARKALAWIRRAYPRRGYTEARIVPLGREDLAAKSE